MVNFLYRNIRFFNKDGLDLNPIKIYFNNIIINSSIGFGAILDLDIDENGDLQNIIVLNSGNGYDVLKTNIDIVDSDGNVIYNIPNSSITFDTNGGIVSVNIGSPPSGVFKFIPYYYYSELYVNDIPQNLVENQCLYIFEDVIDNSNNNNLSPPRINSSGYSFLVQFEDLDDNIKKDKDCIQLFDVDLSQITPFIEYKDNLSFNLIDGSLDTIVSGKRKLLNIDYNNIIDCNIKIGYKESGVYYRYLNVYLVDNSSGKKYILLKLKISCNIISEDDRLNTILTNLGVELSKNDEYIFRKSDINEPLPNVKIINEKRKEFILEYSNIIPRVGSYKGLFNVLNFLGYNDLRIREYLLNVNDKSLYFKKLLPFDIDKKTYKYKNTSFNFKDYKKTKLLSLVYDLNKVTDEFDDEDLPKVVDSFDFTIEEVLIKLFNLKKYLKDKFLALDVDIIDITGEGVYFAKYSTNKWQNLNASYISDNKDYDFVLKNSDNYIIDLRRLNNYNYFRPASLKPVIDTNTGSFIGIIIEDGGFGYLGDIYLKINGNTPTVDADIQLSVNSAGEITGYTIVNPGLGYNPYLTSLDVVFDNENQNIQNLGNITVNSITNRILFSLMDVNNDFINDPNADIGAVFIIDNNIMDLVWDDIIGTWGDYNYTHFVNAEAEVILGPGGSISSINIINPGVGYESPPTVVLLGGNPTTSAVLGTPIIANGGVINIPIINQGSGYVYPPTVQIIGGYTLFSLYTWDNIGVGNNYETEYIIKGPNNYIKSYRNKTELMDNFLVTVPFVGFYDVEMRVYNLNGFVFNKIKKNAFDAKLPEIKINTITRYKSLRESFDEMDGVLFNEASFDYVLQSYHKKFTYNNLGDLKWEDLMVDNYKNITPTEYKPVKLKEWNSDDIVAGDFIDLNRSAKKIYLSNAVCKPSLKVGDIIYFKKGLNIIPSKIVALNKGYGIKNVNIINGGNYTISYDFLNDVYVKDYPVINISPSPLFGNPAALEPILDCSITNVNLLPSINWKLDYVYDIDNNILSTNNNNNLVGYFKSPELNTSSVIKCDITLNSSKEVTSISNISPVIGTNSGYRYVPNIVNIKDTSLSYNNKIISSSHPLKNPIEVEIVGSVIDVNISYSGIGYITPPTITFNTISTNTQATATCDLDYDNPYYELQLDVLPDFVDLSWSVMYKVKNTVIIDGYIGYDSINNINGIDVNDYLYISKQDTVVKDLNIIDKIHLNNDSSLSVIGIKINGDYTNKLIFGSKCQIHKKRILNNGNNPNDYNYNSGDDFIIIKSPTFNVYDEIVVGVTVIKDKQYDSNNILIKEFNYLVSGIELVGSDYKIKLKGLDGSVYSINIYGNSALEYNHNAFFSDVYSFNYNSILNVTEIYFDFNKFDYTSDFYNANLISDLYYVDINYVYGEYSFKVLNYGNLYGDTILYVDDSLSQIYLVDTNFNAIYTKYDYLLANKLTKLNNFNYDLLQNATYNDLWIYTYDMLDEFVYSYCNFIITDVDVGGKIIYNDIPFTFTGINSSMTLQQRLIQAANELNNTTHPELQKFEYHLYPNSINPIQINAVAKNPSGDNLGYMEFICVESEYNFDLYHSHSYPIPIIFYSLYSNFLSCNDLFNLDFSTLNTINYVYTGNSPNESFNNANIQNQSNKFYITSVNFDLIDSFVFGYNNEFYISSNNINVINSIIHGYSNKIVFSGNNININGFELVGHQNDIIISTNILNVNNINLIGCDNNINITSNSVNVSNVLYKSLNNTINIVSNSAVFNTITYFYNYLNNLNYNILSLSSTNTLIMNYAALSGSLLDDIDKDDVLIRTYREWGLNAIDLKGWYPSYKLQDTVYYSTDNISVSHRIPYLRAVSGSFNFNESIVYDRNVKVPLFTKLFFVDNSLIAAKKEFKWKIYKDNKLLCESDNDRFVWLFLESGNYDLEVTIKDKNNNIKKFYNKGWVEVVNVSNELEIVDF